MLKTYYPDLYTVHQTLYGALALSLLHCNFLVQKSKQVLPCLGRFSLLNTYWIGQEFAILRFEDKIVRQKGGRLDFTHRVIGVCENEKKILMFPIFFRKLYFYFFHKHQ